MSNPLERFGRAEIMVGVAVIALIALVAVPLGRNMSKKAKRNELINNANSLRVVVMAHHDAFQEYVTASPAPREVFAVDPTAVPWSPTEGFRKLSWAPEDPMVYGSYKVDATGSGFKITATADIDGDGQRSIVEATEGQPAKLVSDDPVY